MRNYKNFYENGNEELSVFGTAPKAWFIKGRKENGDIIEIPANDAYFHHKLTTEDLFTVDDCDKVLAGMEHFQLVECQDAQAVVESCNGLSYSTFTKDLVLQVRRALAFRKALEDFIELNAPVVFRMKNSPINGEDVVFLTGNNPENFKCPEGYSCIWDNEDGDETQPKYWFFTDGDDENKNYVQIFDSSHVEEVRCEHEKLYKILEEVYEL